MLGSLLGDARMLSNIWGEFNYLFLSLLLLCAVSKTTAIQAILTVHVLGLLPIIQWLTSLERNPPPTRRLHTIERLQGWSMLCYYPLEHLYYLVSHSIIPPQLPRPSIFSALSSKVSESKDSTINLNTGVLSRLSVRFWALYVFLQFAHLREDSKLLKQRERVLGKSKVSESNFLSHHTCVQMSIIFDRQRLHKPKKKSFGNVGTRSGVKSL